SSTTTVGGTFFEGPRTRRVDESVYRSICMMAGKLFAGVRFFFAKYVRNKMNSFFLDPMFQHLSAQLTDHFRRLDDTRYEELFHASAADLRARSSDLGDRLRHLSAARDRFRQLQRKLATFSESLFREI